MMQPSSLSSSFSSPPCGAKLTSTSHTIVMLDTEGITKNYKCQLPGIRFLQALLAPVTRCLEATWEKPLAKWQRLTGLQDWNWASTLHTHFCIGLSSTRTISSVLDGIFLNTSALSRRNMWGPSMSCSFLIWSSLAMSANSSKKPSKLLQKKKKVIGEGETKKWIEEMGTKK